MMEMARRMVPALLLSLLLWPLTLLAGAGGAAEGGAGGTAWLLELQGAVSPASADYVVRGIERAQAEGAKAVVLRMDTPGGLDAAMRDIIRAILASRIPVITYVAPGGARAASAGTYILYASHVAAMAPATNLGAATPVQIGGGSPLPLEPPKTPPRMPDGVPGGVPDGAPGDADGKGGAPKGTMEKKIVNDAVAYIRGLAELRGRDAAWAEEAVREGHSLSASAALGRGVIDLVAEDLEALLRAADGRRVKLAGEEVTLATAGLELHRVAPDWRTDLLALITDPNVAYILMLVGIYGLIFEMAHPGFVLPGVVGAVCLLLALFAFQLLPVNYAGLALMALGIAFMVAEAFTPSFGALGIGGVAAFAFGSVILIDAEGYSISIPLIAGFSLASAAFFIGVVALVLRIRRRPVVSGREEMIGAPGTVLEDFEGLGRARVHGEVWQVRSARPLTRGTTVRVTALEGLVLHVERDGS